MTNKKQTKIDVKRLLIKSIESGFKKAIELAVLALMIGATMKLVLASIPAVMTGVIIAKVIKVGVLKQ